MINPAAILIFRSCRTLQDKLKLVTWHATSVFSVRTEPKAGQNKAD